MTVIAFQGEHGAYSEEAIRQSLGREVQTLPCRSLEDLFEAVESGQAAMAALPIENSVAGSINRSYDLLLERDLKVCGEILLHVRHMLMAPPGTTLDQLTEVRSHPQALAQCERYLNQRGLKAVPWYDTAGSAKDLAAEPVEGVGVIASALAAELYGLEILERDIQDLSWNYTRFFLISREEPERQDPSKTSLVFATPHTPGALHACLGEFASRGINLTKLESRPRRNRPWHYVFYLDFEGHWQDPPCREALVGLLARAAFVKLLGSYPAAPLPKLENGGQEALLQI